jgi:glycosyltransferase involved in cell wall biosynthesis
VRALHLLVPGDPETVTGGYAYDRRVVAGLRRLGWQVTVHALDASFPLPTPAALEAAAGLLASLPDDALVMIDGLAYGAMPDVAAGAGQRLRLVALVHHPLAAETGLEPKRAAALRESERRALAAACRVVATSAATARALAGLGVALVQVSVVEPGTDPAPLATGSDGGAPALLCVATVTPRKGHLDLVEALGRIADRDWVLTCVGSLERSPRTAGALRGRVDALGLGQRVRLLGEVSEKVLARLYHRTDVFVLATRMEGYGMALAEALARGLPVVATRGGAVADTVPTAAGLLVPPGDIRTLSRALARVLDEPELRLRLARGARAARVALPDWNASALRMAAVLESVARA